MILLAVVACGTEYQSGTSELVRVRDGTFHDGALPIDDSRKDPTIVYASGATFVLTAGSGSVGYDGLATPETYSVGVALEDVSTGYWTVPVDGPSVTENNNLLFGMTLDFLEEVPAGLQSLSFVALDENGNPGPEYASTLCVLPDWADNNLSVCSKKISPQSAVVALRWDTNVDLDLRVVAPNGKVLGPGKPTTGIAENGSVPHDVVSDPTTGKLTRDSNASCIIDNIRLESIVFVEEPPAGDYEFYADLYASCGEPYVNFSLDEYRRTDTTDGTHPVETTHLGTGELIAVQEDGGSELGTLLTTLTLP
jgi:hypothetical protein